MFIKLMLLKIVSFKSYLVLNNAEWTLICTRYEKNIGELAFQELLEKVMVEFLKVWDLKVL